MIAVYRDLPYPPQGSGLHRTADPGRPHLTAILRRIATRLKLAPDYSRRGGSWDMGLAADIGFMWEDAFSHAFGGRDKMVTRLGEIEVDGVIGSPDGVGPFEDDPTDIAVYENKATWKSSRTLPESNWLWMEQIKSYCYMLGLKKVVMPIVYLVGDWRGSGPVYREARFVFTQGELEGNWLMVLRERDKMLTEGERDAVKRVEELGV